MSLHPDSQNSLESIFKLSAGKRIVFVSGNFNVIHPGHIRLLRFAKECGDYIVVGVLDSRSTGAVVSENLRLEGIKSISWVDFGFVLRDNPRDFIQELKPSFVIKGKEWEGRNNPEAEAVEKYGGKLLFGSGEIAFSSVDLIRKEWGRLNFSTIQKPKDFLDRHGLNFELLLAVIERFKKLRVCVIGDTIVDEYISCDPLGMSQEDPTIVVTPVLTDKFVGGAAIVAAHAQSLGGNVNFFSVTGDDPNSSFVMETLEKGGVIANLYRDKSRPTTYKQRFRAAKRTLISTSHLRQHSISVELRNQIFSDVKKKLENFDLVIFSDFNYGCLPQSLVDEIVNECRLRGIMMVADSQSSSQLGDISRFKLMSLITPTEREARIALHEPEIGLVVLCEKIREKAQAKNVIITLGSEGILIHAYTDVKNQWLTDRLPAFNTAPKDASGAGDSFLTCASMCMALGCDIWLSTYLGSLAAACQVGRIGNIPLSPKDLKSEIEFGL